MKIHLKIKFENHLQNFENFGNECAEIKNQFLIFRKSLCKIAGNPWKSILKSINQNAFFFPGRGSSKTKLFILFFLIIFMPNSNLVYVKINFFFTHR
jgi:hypothetical protein